MFIQNKHRRVRNTVLFVVSAVVLVLGACIAGYTYSRARSTPQQTDDQANIDPYEVLNLPSPSATASAPAGPAMAQPQNMGVLNEKAVLILRSDYSLCGHSIDKKVTKDIMGKSEQDLADEYSDYSVVNFGPTKATLSKKFEAYCPDHYILKSEQGILNIYKTAEGEQLPKLERTLEDVLVPPDAALEQGIVFDSLEAVELYLENIDS